MFTIEQIKEAHAKVKSGADFPQFIREIKRIGVGRYTTYISDGHTDYGDEGQVSSEAKYPAKYIKETADSTRFAQRLAIHQRGETDYPTFCQDAAACGVARWEVLTGPMTCTYYDLSGNSVLAEPIP